MTATTYTIGSKVQRISQFVREPIGEIVEIDADRVRVLWPATGDHSAPKRTYLQRKGFGKRWKLAA